MLEKFLLVAPELWRAFGETLLMLGIGLSAAVLLPMRQGLARRAHHLQRARHSYRVRGREPSGSGRVLAYERRVRVGHR